MIRHNGFPVNGSGTIGLEKNNDTNESELTFLLTRTRAPHDDAYFSLNILKSPNRSDTRMPLRVALLE